MPYRLNINGAVRQVDVPAEMPLLWVLRNELGLVGTKYGCGKGFCGSCTVHVDGAARRSCQLQVGNVGNAIVRPDKSCRRVRYSPTRAAPATISSTRQWPATSAAAAVTTGSAVPFELPRVWKKRRPAVSHELPVAGLERRALLKASLLAGGGLALEALIPLPALAVTAAGEKSTAPAELSAFVSIATDGTVTIVSHDGGR